MVIADDDQCILFWISACPVDKRGSFERDHAILGRKEFAAARKDEEPQDGRSAAGPSGRHFGSLDVWSCKILQRSP
jgi:hypothetical protein